MEKKMLISKIQGPQIFMKGESQKECTTCSFKSTCIKDEEALPLKGDFKSYTVGQQIIVSMQKKDFFMSLFLCYLLPLLLFISMIMLSLYYQYSEEFSLLNGVMLLAFYYFAFWGISKKYLKSLLKIRPFTSHS